MLLHGAWSHWELEGRTRQTGTPFVSHWLFSRSLWTDTMMMLKPYAKWHACRGGVWIWKGFPKDCLSMDHGRFKKRIGSQRMQYVFDTKIGLQFTVDNWLKTLTKGSWKELMINATFFSIFHKKARRLTSWIIKTVTMNRKEEILQFEGHCKKVGPYQFTPFIYNGRRGRRPCTFFSSTEFWSRNSWELLYFQVVAMVSNILRKTLLGKMIQFDQYFSNWSKSPRSFSLLEPGLPLHPTYFLFLAWWFECLEDDPSYHVVAMYAERTPVKSVKKKGV